MSRGLGPPAGAAGLLLIVALVDAVYEGDDLEAVTDPGASWVVSEGRLLRDIEQANLEIIHAKEFLEELLADSPVPGATVREAATKAGHTWATVRRAKTALGVSSEKQGMKGPWLWQLPAKVLTDPEDAHPSEVCSFGEDEHLREADNDVQGAEVETVRGNHG